MKMLLLNSALLLSSIGMSSGYFTQHLSIHSKYNAKSFLDDSMQTFLSKRRKGIEDLVVDGIIDSTKKLLSFEDELTTSTKRRNIKSFQPKTENQKAFLDLMRDDSVDIIIAIGPAGTGKTMLACYAAVEALRLGKINKIVVTRPVVSVDEEIGFLPGGLESKMDPWTRPIFDTLRETYSAKEIEKMTEEGIIEIVPLGFMRVRTFKNAWIIADEMQNSSPTQMFMLATRIGEGSKMIITGDLNQSDLNPKCNGLLEIYNKVKQTERMRGLNCVRYIELDKEDVQRSRAAKVILDIYETVSVSTPKSNAVDLQEPSSAEQELRESLLNLSNKSLCIDQCEVAPVTTQEQPTSALPSSSDPPASNKNLNSPKNVDWVNIDNDAALIPLRHFRRLT